MEKQELRKLVNKYIDGKCLPDEKLLVEKYLESFYIENAEWNEKELGDKRVVEGKIYSGIMRKIKDKDKSAVQNIITSKYFLKIAASIIFLLILATVIFYISGIFNGNSNSLTWVEKNTIPGEKIVLRLADNSEITLNAESKFRYPVRFQGRTREVYLEGEAYFDIARDTGKPFIVHCKNLSTTVLGTRFNINAYSNEKEISISLVEGKVNVSENEAGNIPKRTILKPLQQFLYSTIKKTYQITGFDTTEITGWKDNFLKFKDETLRNVFVRLERAYGVKFELEPISFESYIITTNFQNTSLSVVSEVIKKLTGLNYSTIRENGQVKEIVFAKK